MATQDAVTNALAALSGSTTALVAALLAAAAIWLGADYLLSALDVHLPVRQLLAGRSLQALTLPARYAYIVATGHLPASLFGRGWWLLP